MDDQKEYVELELVPLPPHTVSSARDDVEWIIESILKESGKDDLLADGEIEINVENTFPADAALIVGLTLLSNIALETFKELILPELKKKFKKVSKKNKNKKKKK